MWIMRTSVWEGKKFLLWIRGLLLDIDVILFVTLGWVRGLDS